MSGWFDMFFELIEDHIAWMLWRLSMHLLSWIVIKSKIHKGRFSLFFHISHSVSINSYALLKLSRLKKTKITGTDFWWWRWLACNLSTSPDPRTWCCCWSVCCFSGVHCDWPFVPGNKGGTSFIIWSRFWCHDNFQIVFWYMESLLCRAHLLRGLWLQPMCAS